MPRISNLRCDFIEEEGSEWVCRYREQASSGRWVPLLAYVTTDGKRGWILIDSEICTADEAVAEPERCTESS